MVPAHPAISRDPRPEPAANPAPTFDPAAVRAGAGESWWQAVSTSLEGEEYAAKATGKGFQAANGAQNLRTTFQERGIEIVPRTAKGTAPAWRFAWETTSIGRPGHKDGVPPSSPSAADARIVYHYDGWSEWYENTADGLEQGFTVERRLDYEGPLEITGTFPAELHPEKRADGAVDFMDDHSVCVLRYGNLHVEDAKGQSVPSELIVGGDTVTIQIDDRDAAYPLMVDPLLTSPSWAAEGNQLAAEFGTSVGTAGDVNGDGFSDVIVGAPYYDNQQEDEGRAYVYLGSAAGLGTTPAWTAEGNQAFGNFAWSVGTAGDVNGDGFSDVIVGALFIQNAANIQGAFVYHGSASGLGASPAWIAENAQTDAAFGLSVGTAGDVNGDGYGDVIIGAPDYDNGQSNEGRAFVYYGSAGGLAASPAWTGESDQAGASYAYSVSTAGDVNADGYGDIIVGAWQYDNNNQPNQGRAFVYLGSASGLGMTAAWFAESGLQGCEYGKSVANAGDLNGDGYGDVLVGAPRFNNPEGWEGRVYAYLGSTSGLAVSPGWTAESNQAGAEMGNAVATAGDVNGDGYSDVIIGAHQYDNGQGNEGRAVMYQGSATGLGTTAVWTSEVDQGAYGGAVGCAGDVNGDGYTDVIVGAHFFANGQGQEGKAFVYHGLAAGLAISSTWTAESNVVNGWYGDLVTNAGDVNGDGFSDILVQGPGIRAYYGSPTGPATTPSWISPSGGYATSSAGDVNGDGYSDVIIGFPGYDNGQTNEGRAWVHYGSAGGLSNTIAWSAESDQAEAGLGISVGTAGDVNGDGFSDVIIAASKYDNGETDEGRVYVYHGSATGLSSTPAWTAESNQVDAHFGASVATAGDVNGDGFSDVIVGTGLYDNGQQNEGRAFAYHGSAAGLATTPAWSAESNVADSRFGDCVATAGDVNGDGFSDVIVGAWQYLTGPNNEGAAFLYPGSAAGLTSSPGWSVVSEFTRFGWSLSTAGDVNGDGFSDVVVGAYGYSNGQGSEGAVLGYYGSGGGLNTFPSWIAESNQALAWFGESVSTAGDVNGDGFSDVIVGALKYDNGQLDEGRAYIFLGNEGDGLDRIARQGRSDNLGPIDLLGGSDSPTTFRLKARGRTAFGRGSVQLQCEVKPLGTPFDGSGLGNGIQVLDTGVPGGAGSAVSLNHLVSGLVPNTAYHWRLRILSRTSPFFPSTPWLTMPYNNRTELDVRTASGTTGIELAETPPSALLLEVGPNPVTVSTEIGYTLPKAGRVRLAIYDVTGRERAVLAKAIQEGGRQRATWDGRDARGKELASGVYFIRLESKGQVAVQKVVINR